MSFTPSFNKENGRCIVLGRLSYFKGFKKTASVEGGSLKYRMNALFDPDTKEGRASIAVIEKARKHLVTTTWPGKDYEKFVKALKDRAGFFDGNNNTDEDGDVREHFEDMMYLSLSSDKFPKYLRRNGEPFEKEEDEEREEAFRSGYHALLYFHFFPIKDAKKGGNGIFCNVDAVQFYKKDEEFAGGGIGDDEIVALDDEDDDMEDKPKSKKGKRPSVDDDDDDL